MLASQLAKKLTFFHLYSCIIKTTVRPKQRAKHEDALYLQEKGSEKGYSCNSSERIGSSGDSSGRVLGGT